MTLLVRASSTILSPARRATAPVLVPSVWLARPQKSKCSGTQQLHRAKVRAHAKRATEEDERLIEEMKRAAEKGDLLEGGFADVAVKILAVAAAVGLIVVLTYLGQPVIENTIESFPKAPAS